MSNRFKRIIALGIALAYVFIIYKLSGIGFETNDDRLINSILTGVITGEPNATVFFLNSAICFPLKVLYSITTQVPWYGLFLTAMYVLGYWALLDSLFAKCKSIIEMIISAFVAGTVCILFWYIIGQIQFTSTAIFLASVGYACLIFDRGEKSGIIKFTVFEMMASFLRIDAMLLVQPFGFGALGGLILFERKVQFKEKVKKLTFVLGCLLLVIVMNFVFNLAGGYYGKEMREFSKYNQSRSYIADYPGVPMYEVVEPILTKHGISKEQYIGYIFNANIEKNMTLECQEEIAQYLSERIEHDITSVIKSVTQKFCQKQQWNITAPSWVLSVILLIVAVCSKQHSMLPGWLGLQFGKFVVWSFLYYRGRILDRVTVPLFFCEVVILLAILCRGSKEKKINGLKKNMLYAGVALLLFVSARPAAVAQYRYIKERNQGQDIYITGLQDIIDYCNEHPENHYVLDLFTTTYYKGSAFETEIYQPGNYVFAGGWFSELPDARQYMEEYATAKGAIYLIVYREEHPMPDELIGYYSYVTGGEPILVDQFSSSIGNTFDVIKFEYK